MKKLILLFLFSLLFCACSKHKNQNKEVIKTNPKERNWVTLAAPKESEKRVKEEMQRKGKVFQNLEEIGEDSPYYSNLTENMPIDSSQKVSLVCRDPIYGITYFINYGRDFLIYAELQGNVEAICNIPAKSLYTRNGELYFIVSESNLSSFIKEGDIVKYSPKNGEITILISDEAFDMKVYKDSICYWKKNKVDENGFSQERKSYSFQTSKTTTLTTSIDRYLDYAIEIDWFEWKLILRDSNGKSVKEINRESISSTLMNALLKENQLYLVVKTTEDDLRLLCYNLSTDEVTVVYDGSLYSEAWCSDFILYQGLFLWGDGFQYDRMKNQTSVFYIEKDSYGKKKYVSGSIKEFFTDGERLYGVVDGKIFLLISESFEKVEATPYPVRLQTKKSDILLENNGTFFRLVSPTEQ